MEGEAQTHLIDTFEVSRVSEGAEQVQESRAGMKGGPVWHKRLSDEDVTALRADMRAGFEAAKIHGVKFPMSQLIELTGISASFLGNIYNGKRGSTLPTANTIRDGLKKMLADAPGAADTANALAESLPPPPMTVSRGKKGPRTMPESFKVRRRATHRALIEAQDPLRVRIKAYCTENDITKRTFARRVGGLSESAISYFLSGKAMRPENFERVKRYLDKRGPSDNELAGLVEPKKRGRPPKSTALVHQPDPRQRPLPFSDGGNVIAVAAAMHPLHRSPPTVSGETRSPGDIARAFLAEKLGGAVGIEAIETLLRIARST